MKKKKDSLKEVTFPIATGSGKIRHFKISRESILESMRKIEITKEKDQRDLEARAKPLYELTREEKFTVEYVIAESYNHIVSPRAEMMIGGRSGSYDSGQSTKTTITVKPESNIPVRSLSFAGALTLRKGDQIKATIPRVESHGDEERFSHDCMPRRVLYTDRPYKEKEEAIEITTLRSDELFALRTDRSANYKTYEKPKQKE